MDDDTKRVVVFLPADLADWLDAAKERVNPENLFRDAIEAARDGTVFGDQFARDCLERPHLWGNAGKAAIDNIKSMADDAPDELRSEYVARALGGEDAEDHYEAPSRAARWDDTPWLRALGRILGHNDQSGFGLGRHYVTCYRDAFIRAIQEQD